MPNTELRTLRHALVAAALGALALTGCSSSSSGGAPSADESPAAHSETFHDITPKVNHDVQRSLPLMRGVASTTYQDGDLIVTFKPDATKLDQNNVENIVTQTKSRPVSPSPKASKKK